MDRPAKRIAALYGGTSRELQGALAAFARELQSQGYRVAGVIEESLCGATGACKSLSVRDIASGERIPISQKLGAGSEACNLDPGGLAFACGLVEEAIERGADVVVLSKFGKLEASRSGLCDAFKAAILADIPIITTVSPHVLQDWVCFAGGLSEYVPPDIAALAAWWRATRGGVSDRALAGRVADGVYRRMAEQDSEARYEPF
jgi:nucleoside-triphosphatase THEP1